MNRTSATLDMLSGRQEEQVVSTNCVPVFPRAVSFLTEAGNNWLNRSGHVKSKTVILSLYLILRVRTV